MDTAAAPIAPVVFPQEARSSAIEITSKAKALVSAEINRQSIGEIVYWDCQIAVVPGPEGGLMPIGVVIIGIPNPILGQGPIMSMNAVPNPLILLEPEHVNRIVAQGLEQARAARSEGLKV